jgi:hypothetical protein
MRAFSRRRSFNPQRNEEKGGIIQMAEEKEYTLYDLDVALQELQALKEQNKRKKEMQRK